MDGAAKRNNVSRLHKHFLSEGICKQCEWLSWATTCLHVHCRACFVQDTDLVKLRLVNNFNSSNASFFEFFMNEALFPLLI
jgi:hypothetical protein